MKAYLDLLRKIMTEGKDVQSGAFLPKEGRKPWTKKLFGEQIRFNLADGFPAVTTKPLWWRAVVAEWIWFMRGDGNIQYLRDQKVSSIWESWVKKDAQGNDTGDLGPVYGRQFRRFQGVKWQDRAPFQPDFTAEEIRERGYPIYASGARAALTLHVLDGYLYGLLCSHRPGRLVAPAAAPEVLAMGPYHEVVEVDQIGQIVRDIRGVIADPADRARRRIIGTLWNPAQVPAMALPPCHTFHFYDLVPPGSLDKAPCDTYADFEAWRKDTLDGRWTLNLHLCARSIDAVKGLPFNIASYALMLSVMARITGCRPGELLITFNDVHIYDNQFADVAEQLKREPYPLPTLGFATDGPDGLDALCKDLTIAEAHNLEPAMFQLINYKHHPKLASESEVAV